MKIGIYADPHIAVTSSIFPLTSATKYTRRLEMIIKSYEWMYETFHDAKVDVICNCGDTFDSHIVKAEEATALAECLSFSAGTPEIWILGNHEIFNNQFSSTSLIKNYNFIELYDHAEKIDDTFSVLPYTKALDINPSDLVKISNNILISHIDIKGAHLRPDFIADSGVDPEYLAMNFKITFNGHIHTGEIVSTSENTVINVGSIATHSFSDSNTYIPRILIYDTETNSIEEKFNPHAVLFRKLTCNSITELLTELDKLSSNRLYILRVTCPFRIRDDVYNELHRRKIVLASRVTTIIDESSPVIGQLGQTAPLDITSSSIKSKFSSFLNENDQILKYPRNYYDEILKKV